MHNWPAIILSELDTEHSNHTTFIMHFFMSVQSNSEGHFKCLPLCLKYLTEKQSWVPTIGVKLSALDFTKLPGYRRVKACYGIWSLCSVDALKHVYFPV